MDGCFLGPRGVLCQLRAAGLLINGAVHVRCVPGTVGGSVLRREREPGWFHRDGDSCGRTRSRYQECGAGKSGPGREQAVKRPGSLKQHDLSGTASDTTCKSWVRGRVVGSKVGRVPPWPCAGEDAEVLSCIVMSLLLGLPADSVGERGGRQSWQLGE